MSDNPSARVGILAEVGGDYFTARLIVEIDDTVAQRKLGSNARLGQVGSYLTVQQANSQILVIVERSYRVADRQGHAASMVRVTPVGQINADGKFNKGVSAYPSIGDDIYAVSYDSLNAIFSADGEVAFKVGQLSAFRDVKVHLDASAFFGRHAAILGQSGAGKSWTVTSLIQSALRCMPQSHIILLDMHGEYSDKEVDGVVSVSPFPPDNVRCLNAQQAEFPYWLLTYSELCDLIIDPTDEDASIQTTFLRSILMRLKRESNEHLKISQLTVDSPVYYCINTFVEMIEKANSETSDFGKKKSPLFGKFDQLLVRLNSLFGDTRYDFLMKPKLRTSTESLAGLMRDLVGLGEKKAGITVLDLSAVPFDVAPMVTAQIGRLAFEFNFWNPQCRDFPIFLICEEAHEYIPRLESPRFREARRAMERISKNGRKYGVGICVVSQRPADVSETILAQCSSYICLRISNPSDQDYVRSMVPEAAKGTFAALTSLGKGEVVALGEAVPMPVRFQMDMPDPPPNSTDIDYAGKWRDGDVPINVESVVQNWHQQLR
ncbi:MAG: ATP-binding protein [Halioglobus sp.]|nr:ATP-binding protein [Halioglobus sp.]